MTLSLCYFRLVPSHTDHVLSVLTSCHAYLINLPFPQIAREGIKLVIVLSKFSCIMVFIYISPNLGQGRRISVAFFYGRYSRTPPRSPFKEDLLPNCGVWGQRLPPGLSSFIVHLSCKEGLAQEHIFPKMFILSDYVR